MPKLFGIKINKMKLSTWISKHKKCPKTYFVIVDEDPLKRKSEFRILRCNKHNEIYITETA